MEQVKQFNSIRSTLTSDYMHLIEIILIISMEKRAFIQKRQLLTNKNLNMKMKKNFVKPYVWSVLLYDCEIWTINKQDKKKLEAMEMWT